MPLQLPCCHPSCQSGIKQTPSERSLLCTSWLLCWGRSGGRGRGRGAYGATTFRRWSNGPPIEQGYSWRHFGFLVPRRQRCHEVKERRRDEPARLRYVWVWKCRECVVAFASFVTDATWGCYRALYIVSVSSLHMKYTHYAQTPENPLFHWCSPPNSTPLQGKKSHQSLAARASVRLSSFLALPDQIITRSTTFHHLGCIRGR